MPLLTLHVLPPAFSLPSISPPCIAAIATLRYTQQYGTWIVVADAAEYPSHEAPFLVPAYHHSETSPAPIEGLDAISQYLHTTSDIFLDAHLSHSQQSQVLALASHLELRLQPLISLSLYVSSDNYSAATRPSFAAVLPFPESWILPNHLYKQALDGSAHLGIDPNELSLLADDGNQEKAKNLADAGPLTGDDAPITEQSNSKTKLTIAARVKLQRKIDDLVYAALAPLVSILGLSSSPVSGSKAERKARWLFSGSNPTTADITALALLSPAILPYSNASSASANKEYTLAIPFLSASIHRQFPNLASNYLLPALEDAFAGKTSRETALFSAPLAASASEEDEEEDGALDDAVQGYGNLDIGSGRTEIPWRRKHKTDQWESVSRIGNAVTAVFGGAIGIQ